MARPNRFDFLNPQKYYMRIYRNVYQLLSFGVSAIFLVLVLLSLIFDKIRLSLFFGLILVGFANLVMNSIFRKKFLDALVELEWVLSKPDETGKRTPIRSDLPDVRRPGALDRMVDQIEQAINNEYNARLLRTQAEIHALQSQINPHFLYNTLETIRSQAIVQHVPEIEEMAEALATLFRYGISSQGEMSTLAKELKCVENYFVIQQHRFSGRYQMVKMVEESNEMLMKCQIPILTLQPIIENAIVHGLESKLDPGTITIRAEMTQTYVYIQISDNGVGMSEETLDKLNHRLDVEENISIDGLHPDDHKGSGIAMINVNQRIKHFFGKEFGISVTSTLGVGTSVDITLPNRQ